MWCRLGQKTLTPISVKAYLPKREILRKSVVASVRAYRGFFLSIKGKAGLNGLRQFRTDRILSASLNGSIPYRTDIDQKKLKGKPEKEHLEQTVLLLEMTKKGVCKLESKPRFAHFIQRNEDGSGTAAVQIAAEDLHFYVDLIWQLGEDVKITGPLQAIAYIKQKIESIQLLYL